MKEKLIELVEKHLQYWIPYRVTIDAPPISDLADEILELVEDDTRKRIKNIEHNTALTLDKVTQL